MKEKNPFLEAALFYAKRLNWPVFPVKPRNKKPPLTKNGCLDASTDEKQIREWWKKWPSANVAVRTGTSVWVLDVDPQNGGAESRERLIATYGPLTDTLRQTTGGGGSQYFYQVPEGVVIQGKAPVASEWPGIDSRGLNNYVLVAPSIHPDPPHRRYTWDTAKKSILEEPIRPADDWLLEWVLNGTRARSEQPAELPEHLEKGSRDETIFRMASAFRRARGEFETVVAHLVEYDRKHCHPPLGARMVRAKVENAWKKAPGDHRPRTQRPAPAPEIEPLRLVDGGEIYNADYPEPVPLVDPILYPGLTVLGGRPKAGKSVFALELALAMIEGGKLCGYLNAQKRRCLYLSLEEKPRQTRSRLRKLTTLEHVEKKITFSYEINALLAGGLARLDATLTHASPPFEVVILDSYFAAIQQAGRGNVHIVQADYNVMKAIRELAEKHAIAILVVHHTRKASGGDLVDQLQGTTGTSAAPDAIWILQRTLEAGQFTLSVTGREVPENVFGMRRTSDQYGWTITGEGDAVTQSEARRDILQLLRDRGAMKPSQIAQQLHKSISVTHRQLSALVEQGLLERTAYGTYDLPGEDEPPAAYEEAEQKRKKKPRVQ